MQLQRVIEDTSVVGCPCGACHGSGTYVARNIMGDPISLMECEACGGTGTANKDLQHQVLADLGQRKLAQPGYTDATCQLHIQTYQVSLEPGE
jgi:hypothetical protein